MRRLLALLCVPVPALALVACASQVSTSSFKGEQHAAAQTVANLQADATAGEEKKICTEDLSASVVTRLGGTKGCEAAIKKQLAEVDSLELSVSGVTVEPSGKTATAQVKSIREGKKHAGTVTLVKEGDRWKISALG